VAADDARERRRQIVARTCSIGWGDHRPCRLVRNRCNKGITSAGVIGDVTPAVTAIAECFAQCRDMDPQGTFVDDRIGPGAGNQLFLWDRLAGPLDQRGQDVERTAADAQWLPVVEQHPLRGDQPERSEDQPLVIHGGTILPDRRYIHRPAKFATQQRSTVSPVRVPRRPRRKKLQNPVSHNFTTINSAGGWNDSR